MQTNIDKGTAAVPVAAETPPKNDWRKNAGIWLSEKLTSQASSVSAPPARQRLRLAITCAAIFFVALSVRLLHWQDTRVETLQEDSLVTTLVHLYENEAQRMDEDGGAIFPSRAVDPGDARMLVHPPGYAIMLRGLYGTAPSTDHYFALRMAQVLGDAFAAALLFLVVVELLPLGLALIAGLLAALSPHFAYYALWLSPDSLVVPLVLLGVLFFIKASKQPRLATVITSGAFFGLACWLRANPLLLAPLFALVVFFTFEKGKRLRSAVALVLAMAFVISPITIRNWVVYHRFIPLTIVTGLNLIQGLAEFDKENRFGLPPLDADAQVKDAEWHARPDYAENLFVPDGIERDQYRFKRGVEVIKDNPGWFAKGLALRAAFMLRYNDFGPQNNNTFTSIAPTILPHAGFSHSLEVADHSQPMWRVSAAEMAANFERLSPQAEILLQDSGRLFLQSNDPQGADQMRSPPIPVKAYTDYVLTIPVEVRHGRASLHVRALDARITLQSKNVVARPKKERSKKRKAGDRNLSDEKLLETEKPMTLIPIAFTTGKNQAVRFYLSTDGAAESTILQAGEAQLFEVGPTAYQWTQAPRSLFRGLQKNIFKTGVMRWLIIIGLILLALGRRRNQLLMLLTVPVYYLSTHAAFSTEHRYILALHAFLFVLASLTLYLAGAIVKLGLTKVISKPHWFIQRDRQDQAPTI